MARTRPWSATHRALLDVALAREAAAAGDAERAATLRRAAGARDRVDAGMPASTCAPPAACSAAPWPRAPTWWPTTAPGSAPPTARRSASPAARCFAACSSALLAERAAGAGNAVSSDRLMDAGWPGEHIDPLAAANRLHVGLTTLRNLGLRELLVRDESGYRIAPEAAVIVRRGRE